METIKHNIFVLILIVLCGCSGEYHLRKAYKKGALSDEVVYDTLESFVVKHDTVYDFLEIPYEKVVVKDSIWCDSNNLPVSKGVKMNDGRVSVVSSIDNGLYSIEASCDSIREKYAKAIRTNEYKTQQIKRINKVNSRIIDSLRDKQDFFIHFVVSLIVIGALTIILIKQLLR